jgi:hypothetical protein
MKIYFKSKFTLSQVVVVHLLPAILLFSNKKYNIKQNRVYQCTCSISSINSELKLVTMSYCYKFKLCILSVLNSFKSVLLTLSSNISSFSFVWFETYFHINGIKQVWTIIYLRFPNLSTTEQMLYTEKVKFKWWSISCSTRNKMTYINHNSTLLWNSFFCVNYRIFKIKR